MNHPPAPDPGFTNQSAALVFHPALEGTARRISERGSSMNAIERVKQQIEQGRAAVDDERLPNGDVPPGYYQGVSVTLDNIAAVLEDDPPVDYTPEQCVKPGTMSDVDFPCRYCGKICRWGETVNGRRSLFDVDEPHPNHWITCPKQDEARKAFPR